MSIDETGNKYGRLLVLKDSGQRAGDGAIVWLCLCSCGEKLTVSGKSLRSGNTTSCGCFQKESSAIRMTSHGMSDTPTYKSWAMMKTRCGLYASEARQAYKCVKICHRWTNSFEAFLKDMGERPKDCTLDRIDVEGNYEPGNCRWATVQQQQQNRKCNKLTKEAVREIRALYKNGNTQKQIALLFSVGPDQISRVLSRQSWSNVTEEEA
ncbi:hypothetical protein LCGC14_0243910 [marine sediment metagenome]|uniref:Uncharacterized protein n=1 Tax=marine sediment metagenome TaxID=412755 RepID=A0A0F9UAZ0_9ZZZZ